jgi:hypothetical protein
MRKSACAAGAALLAISCSPDENEPLPDPTVTEATTLANAPDGAANDPAARAGPSPGPTAIPPPDDELGSDRVMQGRWLSKTMAGDPAVLFGPADTEAGFSVRCDSGELVLTRSERRPAGTVQLQVMAGGKIRTLDATSRPDPMPSITARLPADDALARTLASIREPFAVRVGSGSSYRMPADQALRGLIEDCRS